MDWLTSQPVGLLVVGWLGFMLLVAYGSRLAMRTFVPAGEHDDVQRVAAPLMPALGAAFGVLIGLTLASEAGYLKSAQDIVADEAAAASRLAWAATSPGVRSEPIHDALERLPAHHQVRRVARRRRRGRHSRRRRGDRIARARRACRGRSFGAGHARQHRAACLVGRRHEQSPTTCGGRGTVRSRCSTSPPSSSPAWRWSPVPAALGVRGARAAVLISGLAVVVGLCLALLFSLAGPWRGPLIVSGHPLDVVVGELHVGFFE